MIVQFIIARCQFSPVQETFLSQCPYIVLFNTCFNKTSAEKAMGGRGMHQVILDVLLNIYICTGHNLFSFVILSLLNMDE